MNTLEIYYEKGMEAGLEVGLEKGRMKEKESVILKMLQSGKFSDAEIASYSGASLSFVKKTRSSLK